MALLSILPDSFSAVETWLTRIFMVLGMLIIGPWMLLLLYDVVLYLWRSATYELPYIGGRARGKARPRAPSLAERPDGRHRRKISVPGISRPSEDEASTTAVKQDLIGVDERRAFPAVVEDN